MNTAAIIREQRCHLHDDDELPFKRKVFKNNLHSPPRLSFFNQEMMRKVISASRRENFYSGISHAIDIFRHLKLKIISLLRHQQFSWQIFRGFFALEKGVTRVSFSLLQIAIFGEFNAREGEREREREERERRERERARLEPKTVSQRRFAKLALDTPLCQITMFVSVFLLHLEVFRTHSLLEDYFLVNCMRLEDWIALTD